MFNLTNATYATPTIKKFVVNEFPTMADIVVDTGIKSTTIDAPLMPLLHYTGIIEIPPIKQAIEAAANLVKNGDVTPVKEVVTRVVENVASEGLVEDIAVSTISSPARAVAVEAVKNIASRSFDDVVFAMKMSASTMKDAAFIALPGYAIRFASHAYKDQYAEYMGNNSIPLNIYGGALGGGVRYGLKNRGEPTPVLLTFIALGALNNVAYEICNSYEPCANSKLANTILTFAVETPDFVSQAHLRGKIKSYEDLKAKAVEGVMVAAAIHFLVHATYLSLMAAKELTYDYVLEPTYTHVIEPYIIEPTYTHVIEPYIIEPFNNYFAGSNEIAHVEL